MTLDTTQLTKLTITPFEDQAFSKGAGTPWRAMLNPSQLSFTRKNTYQETSSVGSSAPQQSYGGGEPDQVQIDLFLDGTGVIADQPTVADLLERLLSFTRFQPETHQPYYVRAQWGPFLFDGILTQVDLTYTLFDRAGNPLRATAKLSLKQVLAPEQAAAEERRESPDLYQTWMVSDGETLDAIAASVYGDPAYWRPLASANRLRNPRGLVAGQTLLLPPKEK